MDMLDRKNTQELCHSMLAEVAKARNELNCAQRDIEKAQSRLSFVIAIVNRLIERETNR